VKMIDRIRAYVRQNEAGGRRKPKQLTPRQQRRIRHKTNRADKRAALAPPETAGDFGPVPAPCPRCGATGEAPCMTPSSKPTKTHKGREQ
jgi:hypothetical protein